MELAGALRLLLLVLCALLITADSSSDEEPTTCTPGSTFPLDCNTCVCGDDGIRAHAACTMIGCGTLERVVVAEDSNPNEDPTTCTPGTTFPLDCNTCVCGADGIRANAACTLMGCETVEGLVVVEHDNHSSDSCTPGSTFMVDCNTCICGSDGVQENAECTRRDCSASGSLVNRVGGDADGVICNPLENFELGCNTCKCGSDGLVANAACTQNPCPRQLLSALSRKKRGGPMDGVLSERCFPGSPFKVDCNLCLCPVSGIKELAPCSAMVCPPPTCSPNDVECVSDGERCAPGITYMDECNMCICSQDGIKAHASCTFKLCPK